MADPGDRAGIWVAFPPDPAATGIPASVAAAGGLLHETPHPAGLAQLPTPAAALAWLDTAALAALPLALHAGLPAGPEAVPPAARVIALLAAAHPGQVLLSATAATALRPHLPPGRDLRDLGEHRLADLLGRVRIFQLDRAAGPATFPPLRTLDQLPNNLSPQLNPLIGRDSLVAEAGAALAAPDPRLVTLTGPGGIGKTRLAMQVAATVLAAFPDGVWFVSLSSIADVAAIPAAIATTLGVREGAAGAIPAALAGYLAARRLVLVLANCEHLPAAGPLVADLLAGAPGLRALATSGAPLHLPAERVIPVPALGLADPLALPPGPALAQVPAIALFVARARDADPGFALTPQNAPLVAAICARLDGLPLALELAAARIRLFPPAALLARLGQAVSAPTALPLLGGGAPHLPARQQTLRAAIGWSYRLLPLADQQRFAQLAVFVGGCNPAAAAAVTGSTMADLDTLVEHSLLRREPGSANPSRYQMLGTIREYALEQLEELGTTAALRTAHAAYFQAWATSGAAQLAGPDQAAWLSALDADHDNLRAALTWLLAAAPADGLHLAAALGRFLQIRGYLSEGRAWLEAALGGAPAAPADLRARALDAAGTLATNQGAYPAARALLDESLALYRGQDDAAGIAEVLNRLGVLAGSQGDFSTALALFAESLARRRQIGESGPIAIALNNLGLVAYYLGDFPRAAAYYAESLSLHRAHGDRQREASSLLNLAILAQAQGDPDGASRLLAESRAILEALGDQRELALALATLGELAYGQGAAARAALLYEESLALREAVGDQKGVAAAWYGLGLVAAQTGDGAAAARLLADAARQQAALGDDSGLAATHLALGEVARERGDRPAAATHLAAALAHYRRRGEQAGIARSLEALAAFAADADPVRAATLLAAAAALRAQLGARRSAILEAAEARLERTLQERLGPAPWAAAQAAGAALTVDQAVALAGADVADPPAG